jgi:type I restriction enzyme S subunit
MAETKNTKTLYHTEIPSDWEIKELKNCSEFITKGATPTTYGFSWVEKGILFLRSECVSERGIELGAAMFISEEADKMMNRSSLNDEDILMTITGNIGRVCILPKDFPKANINQHIARIRIKNDICNRSFIFQYLKQGKIQNEYLKITTGQAYPQISLEQVRDTKISLPPLPEQRAIAQVLSTADSSIHTTEKLITQKELRKKWLMQQLLTGKKRLKGFEGEWKFVRFKEIYSSIKQKSGDTKYLVLSVTKDGIVSQAEYFNKEIASEDTSPYLVVRKGDMVMSGLNFWMGSIDVLSEYEVGMVSPAYKVFEIHNPKISAEFMKRYVRSEIMLQCLLGSSVVGASIVRRNLDKETLEEWSFKMPPKEEQIAIAQVLQTADKEISLLKAKSEKLREQKKGLMQVLLTGNVRLKIKE